MNLAFSIGAVLGVIFLFPEDRSAAPDVQLILSRSVAANLRNYEALPRLNYFKTVLRPDGTTQTYDEIMVLGSRYSRLVAINGKPLLPGREQEEQLKLANVWRTRSAESPEDRTRRVEAYERERQRDQLLLNEMANAFDFTLMGDQRLRDRDVYVLKARPKRGYRPPNSRAKVLTGMEGTLWIDQATFQWAKVEAEVMRPVTIDGFLARVQPGTRFELEQEPVSDNLWLPTHFSMKARATILFFFSSQQEDDETYYGYRSAQPEPDK
jgi:hypothetical protein